MMTLFMHWYTPLELAKRMGFYHSCQAIGSMLSGALQAAIMRTMDGHNGLAGMYYNLSLESWIDKYRSILLTTDASRLEVAVRDQRNHHCGLGMSGIRKCASRPPRRVAIDECAVHVT
jgi:hypothetical protein